MAQQNSISNQSSELTIDPAAASDAFVQFDESTVAKWILGNDATDDSWRLNQGSTLGDANDVFIMTSAGERTMPLQPAFCAILGTTDGNVTGDGTVFQIGSVTALTERFDQGSDFNTNGTFTAPVSGRYQLNLVVLFQPVNGAHDTDIRINTSNDNFVSGPIINPVAGNFTMTTSVTADMDASDTAVFQAVASTSAKTVGIYGGFGPPSTVISGYLVC